MSGGGTLLTFPALIAAGVPPVIANATSTVALTPGILTSSWAYRKDVADIPHTLMLAALALVGGALGALVLILAPAAAFQRLIPYLLLLATLLFAFSGPIRRLAAHPRTEAIQRRGVPQHTILSMVVLAVAVYGGYFGAGIGLMLLAAFALLGFTDIHAMNAMRTLLAGLSNSAAVLAFVLSGMVDWRYAPLMLAGSVLGGYVGAAAARRVNPHFVRWAVVALGTVLTAWYFLQP